MEHRIADARRSALMLNRPDLLIGSPAPGGATGYAEDFNFCWQWDFAQPEVRGRFLGLFDETMARYRQGAAGIHLFNHDYANHRAQPVAEEDASDMPPVASPPLYRGLQASFDSDRFTRKDPADPVRSGRSASPGAARSLLPPERQFLPGRLSTATAAQAGPPSPVAGQVLPTPCGFPSKTTSTGDGLTGASSRRSCAFASPGTNRACSEFAAR